KIFLSTVADQVGATLQIDLPGKYVFVATDQALRLEQFGTSRDKPCTMDRIASRYMLHLVNGIKNPVNIARGGISEGTGAQQWQNNIGAGADTPYRQGLAKILSIDDFQPKGGGHIKETGNTKGSIDQETTGMMGRLT